MLADGGLTYAPMPCIFCHRYSVRVTRADCDKQTTDCEFGIASRLQIKQQPSEFIAHFLTIFLNRFNIFDRVMNIGGQRRIGNVRSQNRSMTHAGIKQRGAGKSRGNSVDLNLFGEWLA